MASKTKWLSVGELLITWRISAVAACCSCASTLRGSASARLVSRSQTPSAVVLG